MSRIINIGENQPTRIDINKAIEREIVNALQLGPLFSKKVIKERAQIGSYTSLVHFGEVFQLKPEVVEGVSHLLEFKN